MIKSYEQFLLEQKIPPEIEEKYGQYLFGEVRRLEDDTPYEKKQYNDYYNFIAKSFGKGLTGDIVKTFRELLKYKKYYPDVLEPDKYKEIYRGTSANSSTDTFKKLKQIILDNEEVYYQSAFAEIRNYTYRPISEVQSWTTHYNVALRFASPPSYNAIPYMVIANPPRKEMLFNSEFTNNILDNFGTTPVVGESEYEIIRVSGKPLKKCVLLIPIDVVVKIEDGRIR